MEIKKAIWHLGNEVCGCIPDAENKVVELRKKYSDFYFSAKIVPLTKYSGKGKPKEDDYRDGRFGQGHQVLYQENKLIDKKIAMNTT